MHALDIVLDAVEHGEPPGHEAAQALIGAAYAMVTCLAKLDVLVRLETDGKGPPRRLE